MKVRICNQCGARNAEDAWNCTKCSNTLSINSVVDVSDNPLPENTDENFEPYEDHLPSATANESQNKKRQQTSVACPRCLLQDKIEKVTSIVKSQTRTRQQTEWITETYTDKNGKARTFSYPQSYNVVEITDLAKRLSPPERPQVNSFSGCLVFLGGLLLFNAILSLLVVQDLFMILTFLFPGTIIFFAKSNHDTKERARVEEEEPPWKDAMEVWNRMYYCYRDDIVFDGNDAKNMCQPENLLKFCYQQNQVSFEG